jgi:hypothetical protein
METWVTTIIIWEAVVLMARWAVPPVEAHTILSAAEAVLEGL